MALISVIVPAYNSARYLPATLRSVMQQQLHAEVELIVVDDGSTDNSAEVVRSCFDAYGADAKGGAGTISTTLIQKPNGGVASARNLGLTRARGDYIQFLDADDELAPNKLAQQLALLKASGADVCFGAFQRFREHDDGNRVFGAITRHTPPEDVLLALVTLTWWPPVALLFSRGICTRAGPQREDLPIIQDARFLIDCADAGGRFVGLEAVTGYYREHSSGSVSTSGRENFVRDCYVNCCQLMDRWLGRGSLSEPKRQALRQAFVQSASYAAQCQPEWYADIAQRYQSLGGRFVPAGPRGLRILSQLFGYPLAEKIAWPLRNLRKKQAPNA
jgi:glycosyltransferase involved in cell wall biosynthesis